MASSKKRRNRDAVAGDATPSTASDGDRRRRHFRPLARDAPERTHAVRSRTIDDGPPAGT